MKFKVDPLIEHGHKVFVPYDGPAFETRIKTTRSGLSYTTSRNPSKEFQEWLENTAGPLGVLWTTQKDPLYQGIEIYFFQKKHAVLAKLTWGGSQ